jgi:hypothetical protein
MPACPSTPYGRSPATLTWARHSATCTPTASPVADGGKLLTGHLWSQNGPKLHIVRFDSECVVAGQSIFSSVGLTGFEPATT